MKRLLLVIATLATFPLAAQAADLDYNYVQAGYDYNHGDSSNDHPGRNSFGWDGTGSAALGRNFNVFGGGGVSYFENPDVPRHYWNVGAGFHTSISDRTDFVTDLTYRYGHANDRSGDIQTYSGEIGVRSALAPKLEGWVMAGYSNSNNDTDDFNQVRSSNGSAFGKLGGQFKFTKNFGLVAEGTVSENNRGIFVGPRISF